MTTLDDIRYPLGDFDKATGADSRLRWEHVQSIRRLPQHLTVAVADLDDAQLDTPYREGGWTVRQVVHHVADSHVNAYVRIKLALTEDWPTIKVYDQSAWARLPDARLPVGVSLDILTALHMRWVVLLKSLTEAEFARGYVHPVMGKQALDEVVALYSWHSRHHTAHITNLRSRMGWWA